MNAKRRGFCMVSLIILGVVVSTIGTNKENVPKNKEYLSASWVYNYSDLEEMTKDSDMIALVREDKLLETYEEGGLPFSEYQMQVIEPILGVNQNEEITILMTGGEVEYYILEVEDDPLIRDGEEFLVFCKQNKDGTFRVVSGPQGRMVYEDGKLSSLNTENSNARKTNVYMNIHINNVDAETLIDEIKEYLNE